MTDTTIWTGNGYNGWTAERDGFQLRLTMEQDDHHGAPWKEEDGHGPVREGRSNYTGYIRKEPGEIILSGDNFSWRGNARALVYDFAEACRIARRDGWGCSGGQLEGETDRAYAARAARADFDHLRRWANGDWTYNVLKVAASKDGIELGTAYLGGVAYDPDIPDADSYVLECADDMIHEAIEEARDQLERLCECKAA